MRPETPALFTEPADVGAVADAYAARLADLRRRVAEGLPGVVVGSDPEGLYAPMRYALAAEGKRVRPLLVLLAADLYGHADDALAPALAVEVFHTFTLVHDDIMDRAPTRRGRPTVHVRWNEPTAILAGDLLLGEATRLVAEAPRGDVAEMLRVWTTMLRRLCEGQALDMQFETDHAVTVDRYLDMIDRKTGALLACALDLGGLVGGAGAEDRAALVEAGLAIGRAFQIQDDLLDLVADSADWGKAVGGDLVEGKKTFLLLRALERADVASGAPSGDDISADGPASDAAYFRRLVAAKGIAPSDVDGARARMERLGVLDDAREAVRVWTDVALGALARLPDAPSRTALVALVEQLSGRQR